MDHGADPARWYTTNLVGLPPCVVGGTAFNAHPQPLRIAGVREASAGLFALLQGSADALEARELFAHFMSLAFALREAPGPGTGARRWRASYLKLLQGWGLDANGAAGAVLKGWVESRFGIVPAFHKAPLQHFPSPAWTAYLEDKASPRWCNNNVFQQLDLLFEFCQWRLARFAWPPAEGRHVRLWRGTTPTGEQVVAGSLRARRCTVRLNNLVSFSLSRAQAGCFGDWVLEAWVPLAKLLFVPGLLATRSLEGEGEVLALGGDYEVEARYA
jgi:NAD+--dinitrogen-reductase ADP-D-ribosyltransferase